MKTSNKLLILLGALLFVVPIIVIAINVKMNYQNIRAFNEQAESRNHFETPTIGFTSKALNPFSNINFIGEKETDIEINIIKSNKNGIKIPDELKEKFAISTTADGTLQIVVKKTDLSIRYYQPIYIYSNQNIGEFKAIKGRDLTVKISTVSLSMNVSNFSSLSFEPNSVINKLKINAKNISVFTVVKGITNSITMDLENANFNAVDLSFGELNIVSCKNSGVSIIKSAQNENKCKIKSLKINTQGQGAFSLQNIDVDAIEGSLSDSTNIYMSVLNLKKMRIKK